MSRQGKHPRPDIRTNRGQGQGNPILNRVTSVLFERKYGMSILLTLYERGLSRPMELARRLRAHPATMIAMLRALEEAGIVFRKPEPRDRRALHGPVAGPGIVLVGTAPSPCG